MAQPVSAREWGREQARNSPPWSEEKWRRVGAIFGVEFIAEPDRDADQSRDAA
jgi:hypothetical protein